MLRQSIIYLLISIVVVVFAKYMHTLVLYIDMFYLYVYSQIAPIFKPTGLGGLVSRVLLLVLIPILVAAVPAVIYRLIKGSDMPYFLELTWCIWLVVLLSNILIH